MTMYPRLWARLYNAPLFVHPDKAKVIEQVFRSHLEGAGKVAAMEDEPSETAEQRAEREHVQRQRAYAGIELQRADDKPYAVTKSGIALMPVLGTLVQRGSWLDSASGLTSYDSVASMLDRSLSDPDVRAILLEIDSPGGEAAGLVDLANRVYAARDKKPIWAVANEQAYSAAYWLAASAQRLYTPITGGVGSIGAVMLHVDQSKRDAMMGYSYTFIYAGARKIDGNSHQPINKASLKWAQDEVDRSRQLFAEAVGARRSLSVDAVLATEAGLLTPPQALEGSYIDGVATLFEAVALLEGELRQPGSTSSSTGARMAASQQSTKKESSMKNATPAATRILAALALSVESVSDANGVSLEKALTEHSDAARAEGEKAGEPKGAKTERERVRAIMSHAEAKDRQELAMSVATETDMTAEQAGKLLAAAPKQASSGQLAALMGKLANPAVGVDADAQAAAAAAAGNKIDTRAIYARINQRAAE